VEQRTLKVDLGTGPFPRVALMTIDQENMSIRGVSYSTVLIMGRGELAGFFKLVLIRNQFIENF
jgi:hypothetical protein